MLIQEFCKNTNLTKVDAGQHCIIIPPKVEDALRSVGRSRSSDEVPVMGMEAKGFGYLCLTILKQPL